MTPKTAVSFHILTRRVILEKKIRSVFFKRKGLIFIKLEHSEKEFAEIMSVFFCSKMQKQLLCLNTCTYCSFSNVWSPVGFKWHFC